MLQLALAVVVGSGCAGPRSGSIHAGPLYRSTPDFEGHAGFRAMGPLVEHRRATSGKSFTAVRPFWGRVSDPAQARTVNDVLWPLSVFKTRQGELYWWLWPAFGHDFDVEAPASRHRWTVFPILFGGRNAEGDGYFAVFPLGGTLRDILGRDRSWFVLFPLYASSWQGENHTRSVLWPVYSHTRGGDLSRWRVWPLYGYSHNPERWTKRFVLWPIWTSVEYHYPDQEGGGFVLFPLYGKVDLLDRQSRMLLPPFFKLEWGETDHLAFHAPWPILQYVRNPDQNRFYVFPLGGRRRIGHDHSWFALWPVMSGRRTERPREIVTQFRFVPFWYYEHVRSRVRPQTEPEQPALPAESAESLSRYMRLWPLALYRRERAHSVTRVPDLWPLRQTPGIERNWAPLWTLYQRERAGDRTLTELLWGMVRWKRSDACRELRIFPVVESHHGLDARSWRFLYGLLGYRRDDLQKSYQLLYFLRIRRDIAEQAEPREEGSVLP